MRESQCLCLPRRAAGGLVNITRELGKENRLPLVPAANKKSRPAAAMPTQGGQYLMNCIVAIAIPAGPPNFAR
jgi:hypothetical protein